MHQHTFVLVAALMSVADASRSGDDGEALPACNTPPRAHPTDWKTVEDSAYLWALPSHCRLDEKQPGYQHGGQRWLCDGATVELVWGRYGPSSFRQGSHVSACQTTIRDITAVVVRSREIPSVGNPLLVLTVWYQLGGNWYEPAIVLHSETVESLDALSPIAFSWKLKTLKE